MHMYAFTADELAMQGVRDAKDDKVYCRECGCSVTTLYIFASDRESALELIREGVSGFCDECMCHILSTEDYEICPKK